jgi:hypothetical protein
LDPTTIAGALSLAETLVTAIVKAAPAIEEDFSKSGPFVAALAGMIQGTNATMDQIIPLLAAANIDSTDFQTPLPPDDGSTTT